MAVEATSKHGESDKKPTNPCHILSLELMFSIVYLLNLCIYLIYVFIILAIVGFLFVFF